MIAISEEKLPDSILILGKTITLKIADLTYDGSVGRFNYGSRTIEIDRSQLADYTVFKNTLLHEIIHVISYITGQSENLGYPLNESVTRAIEHGLEDMVDLPFLREYAVEYEEEV